MHLNTQKIKMQEYLEEVESFSYIGGIIATKEVCGEDKKNQIKEG